MHHSLSVKILTLVKVILHFFVGFAKMLLINHIYLSRLVKTFVTDKFVLVYKGLADCLLGSLPWAFKLLNHSHIASCYVYFILSTYAHAIQILL